MEQEENLNWTEENTKTLLYFLENISGPWHPSHWAVLIEFVTQIQNWDGQNMPKLSALPKAQRLSLHVSTMMQGFIQSLTEADYFRDTSEFFRFMYSSQSDKNFSLYKFWVRIGNPMDEGDEYWDDFVQQVKEFKENEDNDNFLNYSDAEIASEMERLKMQMEEE
tara:strand:- start:88 stop:582 length:495 start_codon:yes stop_codon:yes gene_type:complete